MDLFRRWNSGGPIAFVLLLGALSQCEGHITYIEARRPLEGTPPPPGSPWPMPQSFVSTRNLFELRPDSFKFESMITDCDLVDKAMDRYRNTIFLHLPLPEPSGLPLLHTLTISIANSSDCRYPHHEMDETYTLTIPGKGGKATLSSKTPWGMLRGMETFSQLVYIDEHTNHYLVNASTVMDWPRFSFRGVHVDTSRHFLPPRVIKENLDAMAYNKFNVFHWHLVDDQSWPYQMKVFANLTSAAYHPKLVYSFKDVKEIIEFARERGIRVIPEIDTPGHTQALGRVFPDILTACYGPGGRGTPNYPLFAAFEMLNPIQGYTYWVVQEILKEVHQTFPDSYMHLGMDEVYYDCWESSPEIARFMESKNMTSVSEVEQFYVKKTLANVKALGAKYMIWQDPLDNGVRPAPDTVIGVWRSVGSSWQEYLEQAVKYGYQIVLSAPWYLNYIDYGQDWVKFYTVDPTDFHASREKKKLVIGGEACMWGEYVDGTNIVSRLWPRASAVAERLWSARRVNDPEEAKWRLDEQRCRMIRRGIRAEPILNGYCGVYDWDD